MTILGKLLEKLIARDDDGELLIPHEDFREFIEALYNAQTAELDYEVSLNAHNDAFTQSRLAIRLYISDNLNVALTDPHPYVRTFAQLIAKNKRG